MAKGNPNAYKNSPHHKQMEIDREGSPKFAKYLQHELQVSRLPKINTADPEAVRQRIEEYWAICIENEMKPHVAGLALAIGVDNLTLYDWKVGRTRAATHTKIIKDAYTILESLWGDYMQGGQINPASGIFMGKNFFGYTDEQVVVAKKPDPLGEAPSIAELQQKYLPTLPEAAGKVVAVGYEVKPDKPEQ